MENFYIKKFEPGMEFEIHNLIKKVYDEFVAIDYSDEGNRFFYEWIEPEKIAERQNQNRSIFVAISDNSIIAMIEMKDNNHISLLFTDKNFQKKGIAKKLFEYGKDLCIKNNPQISKITVNASPYSVGIYKKLGFVETSEMQENNGIKYLQMEFKI